MEECERGEVYWMDVNREERKTEDRKGLRKFGEQDEE